MHQHALWHSIDLVPVCNGFPEGRILPHSSGVYQNLCGETCGMPRKAVCTGNVLLRLNTEAESPGTSAGTTSVVSPSPPVPKDSDIFKLEVEESCLPDFHRQYLEIT